MSQNLRLSQVVLVVSGAVSALLPAGCRTEVNRVCDTMCDCTGCSDAKFEQCTTEATAAENKAGDLGCKSDFDAYLVCVDGEIECRDDKFSYDGCEDEEKKLRGCGVTVFRSVCELASDHTVECQPGSSPQSPTECTGTVACFAQCVLDAPCEALNGLDPNAFQIFNQCQVNCQSGTMRPPEPQPGPAPDGPP